MNVVNFNLSNVRCFEGEHQFNLAPLTFLIGENSTGKSTLLGCMQALSDFIGYKNRRTHMQTLDFNCAPYELGSFSDVVRKRENDQEICLKLGFSFAVGTKDEVMSLGFELYERETGSEPVVRMICMEFEEGEIVWEFQHSASRELNDNLLPDLDLERCEGKKKFLLSTHLNRDEPLQPFLWSGSFLDTILMKILTKVSASDIEVKILGELRKFIKLVSDKQFQSEDEDWSLFSNPIFPPYGDLNFSSLAPIRFKPKRTFDPYLNIEVPEGSEVPTALINLFRTNPNRWDQLRNRLEEFGQSSGLFESINVSPLGHSKSGPFQLKFKIRKGPEVNLIDVGYGVSQILPILGRVLNPTVSAGSTLLMQQPELHLHPRGQAELSSLLVTMCKKYSCKFIVETHSDYMIDRARIEIIKGNIKPEDVSLIYLEPNGDKVEVYNVGFDRGANFVGLPSGYREFFQKETFQLFGIED